MLDLSTGEIEEILNKAIDDLWIPHFKNVLKMEASGQWANSVHTIGREIWGMDYTAVLGRDGRGANLDQSPEAINKFTRWAGSTFIKQWTIDKGLSHLNPYAVAHLIARRGTSWHRTGESDLLEFLNSERFLTFLQDEISKKLARKFELQARIELQKLQFKKY